VPCSFVFFLDVMPDSLFDGCHNVMPYAVVDGCVLTYIFESKTMFFPPKFDTQICEFFLNLYMKCQTALHLWGKRPYHPWNRRLGMSHS